MAVRELMTRDPEACLPDDPCTVAGQIMQRRRCGFVPVVDGQETKRVVGVVTDRDIALYLCQAQEAASRVPVRLCMVTAVHATTPEATLEEAAQAMETGAVHQLPVLDQGRLVGVLALKDIALAAKRQWASAGPHVVERQMADILEAIAAAR